MVQRLLGDPSIGELRQGNLRLLPAMLAQAAAAAGEAAADDAAATPAPLLTFDDPAQPGSQAAPEAAVILFLTAPPGTPGLAAGQRSAVYPGEGVGLEALVGAVADAMEAAPAAEGPAAAAPGGLAARLGSALRGPSRLSLALEASSSSGGPKLPVHGSCALWCAHRRPLCWKPAPLNSLNGPLPVCRAGDSLAAAGAEGLAAAVLATAVDYMRSAGYGAGADGLTPATPLMDAGLDSLDLLKLARWVAGYCGGTVVRYCIRGTVL